MGEEIRGAVAVRGDDAAGSRPRGRSRRRVVVDERTIHLQVAHYLRLANPKAVWMHIPNEGIRTPAQGAFLKTMGMQPGAADFIFLWGGGSGAIEIKSGRGLLTPRQREFAQWCADQGVPYVVCRTLDSVIETLKLWGVLPPSRGF